MKRFLPFASIVALLATYAGFYPGNISVHYGLLLMSLFTILFYKCSKHFIVFILILFLFYLHASSFDMSLLNEESVFEGKIVNRMGEVFLETKNEKILLPFGFLEYDHVIACVTFREPFRYRNIEGFDYLRYLKSMGIDGLASDVKVISGTPVKSISTKASDWLDDHFPIRISSLLKALLVGDKSDFSEDFLNGIRKIQVAHIFAISGFHIAMYYGIINKMLICIPIGLHYKRVMALFILLTYVSMLGYPYSAMRSFIMVALHAFSGFLNRSYCMLSALSLVIIVSLLINPAIIFSVGFWLSSLAVLSISTVYSVFQSDFKSLDYILKLIGLPISVQIILSPITIYYFHTFHLLSVPINVVFGSFFSLLYSITLMLLPVRSTFLYDVITDMWDVFIQLVNWTSKLPYYYEGMTTGTLVLYFLIIGFLVISYTHRRTSAFKLVFLIPFIFMTIYYNEWMTMRITFLDVGQGDGYLIEYKGRTVLIDGGPGLLELESLLLKKGISRLDIVIASHGHKDHYGGIEALMESERIDTFIDGGNHIFGIDDLRIEIIQILSDETNENDNSLVILLKYREFDFISYGDGESRLEYQMMKRGLAYDVDVLKVAHHGSRTSSNENLINLLNPEVGIVQVGKNYYGLPHKERLDQLRGNGVEIFRTDLDGCVIIESDGESYKIQTGVDYGL